MVVVMSIFRRTGERTMHVPPKVNRELEQMRPRRYLVLGSAGHGRGVRAHRWDKLPNDLNVADYDVVVLNFAAFEDKQLAEGFPREQLPSTESMTRLVFSPNAEIIAIGDPSTLIGARGDESMRFYDPRVRADYWLPFHLGVEEDSGTQYSVDAQEWATYFEHVSSWGWIVTGETPPKYGEAAEYLKPVTHRARDLNVAFEPIARTRYDKLIALRVHLRAVGFTRYVEGWSGIAEPDPDSAQLVAEASPIFWLPTPDRVRPDEAIDTILRERYGVAQETRAPDWVTAYPLPDEAPIAVEIATFESDRRAVEQKISDARGRALAAGRPRLLLYEKGKDVLEPIVRETLRSLGARVEDPEVEGIEDGKLFRKDRAAVIEIKGRTGPIKQDDVRQVVQWASDAKLNDGVAYKPLIIGNPHCDKPLEDRGEVLAPNAATYARNGGVAVVTTPQLFESLRQKQRGAFDEDQFWEEVFKASGVAALDLPQGVRARDDEAPAEDDQ
jgi:hypothetical protein